MKKNIEKTREIGFLLIIMYINMYKLKHGFCLLIFDLYTKNIITKKEYDILYEYITNNKPKSLFWSTILGSKRSFYWPMGWKYPRKRWLLKHINLNNNDKKPLQVEIYLGYT